MKQAYNRKTQIIDYIQLYMDQCFLESCQLIQHEVEEKGNEIWREVKEILQELFKEIEAMQKQHEKGKIQYLIFNFRISGLLTDRMEIYIDALDDSFYLDGSETARSYYPDFLQEEFRQDIEKLVGWVEKKFLRLQEHEMSEIKRKYAEYYDEILCEMVRSLSELIVREIKDSSIEITDNITMAYGKYMDEAVIVYAKEKE